VAVKLAKLGVTIFAVTLPAVVSTALIPPFDVKITAVGFGLLTVAGGINVIVPSCVFSVITVLPK